MTLKCKDCRFFYMETMKGSRDGVWMGYRGQCLSKAHAKFFVQGNLNKCEHFENKKEGGGK